MVSVDEAIEKLPEERGFRFETFKYDIEGEADLIRNNDPLIQEMGFANSEELVDDRLEQFYDLCDRHSVWVGLGLKQETII